VDAQTKARDCTTGSKTAELRGGGIWDWQWWSRLWVLEEDVEQKKMLSMKAQQSLANISTDVWRDTACISDELFWGSLQLKLTNLPKSLLLLSPLSLNLLHCHLLIYWRNPFQQSLSITSILIFISFYRSVPESIIIYNPVFVVESVQTKKWKSLELYWICEVHTNQFK